MKINASPIEVLNQYYAAVAPSVTQAQASVTKCADGRQVSNIVDEISLTKRATNT
jgi:hypothetical protein